MPPLDHDNLWSLFDGATPGHPSICIIVVVLFLNKSHYMHVKYSPGCRTNNHSEFIASLTLFCIHSKKISKSYKL